MTVSTTTNKVAYIGNGVATSFAIPFPFLEQGHLKVRQLLNNEQTDRTDWTISGGNMVFATAPADDAQIVIMREVPLTQETDYREETLRRWLERPHKYHPKKKRMRRECSPCFGDLLQIDGSFDVWFGQERTCLMNIVDDATNIARLHFEREETIVSACRCAWSWFQQYGVPRAFYADGRNMYHLDPDKEHNFFTMMCEVLGIRVILAHSPQAKGRVERYNGVHQRRLIPLMKLDGVQDMESANKYLEQYVIAHNKKFSKPAKNGNAHTPLPDWAKEIDDVYFVEVQRKINNDWTVCYKGKIYQITPMSKRAPAVKKWTVKETLSGRISITYRDRSFPNILPVQTVQI